MLSLLLLIVLEWIATCKCYQTMTFEHAFKVNFNMWTTNVIKQQICDWKYTHIDFQNEQH